MVANAEREAAAKARIIEVALKMISQAGSGNVTMEEK